MSHILIVDSDRRAARLTQRQLGPVGREYTVATSGEAAMHALTSRRPDLLVLGVELPDTSGLDLCRRVRSVSRVPILMVADERVASAKAAALYSGADDFLVRPVADTEFQARLTAILHRGAEPAGSGALRRIGIFTLDNSRWIVADHGRRLRLTELEAKVLLCLADAPDQQATYDEILKSVWGINHTDVRLVHGRVSNLSRKLQMAAGGVPVIKSVHGVGYRLILTR